MRSIYYGLDSSGAYDIVEYWGGTDSNTARVSIYPDEFDAFWESGIIDKLNDHYGVIIDDYEEDAIGGDLSYAMECVEPWKDRLPNVYDAFRQAYERKTALLFCF